MVATENDKSQTIKLLNEKLWEEYLKSEKTDIKIRNKIVINNLKLAQSEAHRSHKFTYNYIAYDDLEQQAMISLIWAVEKFNPEKGNQFSTFAVPVIRGRLMNFIRDKSAIIKIPRKSIEALSEFKRKDKDNDLSDQDKKDYKKLRDDISVCRFLKPLEPLNHPLNDDSKNALFDTKFIVKIDIRRINKILSKRNPTPFDILEYRKMCRVAKIKSEISLD